MDSANNSHVYKEKTVIQELTQGLQMAEQLRVNMHSPDKRDVLIHNILSSYENALSVLRLGDQQQPPAPVIPPESPMSIGSPGSEGFEFDQPGLGPKGENVASKKRKEPIIWEDEVRICDDNKLDGNIRDRYNWRKYGQKEIQGAKFPRSYYRCSYRKVQKCFATKQVQRKDEDPMVFDIVYKGEHTCHQSPSPSPSPSLSPPPSSPEKHEIMSNHHQLSQPGSGELLSNLKATLSVNTSDLGGDHGSVPSSFSCPSTDGLIEGSNQLHSPNSYEELFHVYSPPFISPVTPESNIFIEWGSSQSLDFLGDVDTDFEFSSFF